MSIEWWILKEDENKKNKLSKDKETEVNNEIIEHKKVKEKISVELEAENDLENLKQLVSKWVISKETAKNFTEWLEIDDDIIKEMFDKIDQIDEIKDIDNYLPPELRITKQEYIRAINDDIFRVQTLTKLNSALILLSTKIVPDSAMWLNLFTWFLTILDKKLVLIQENTIDVRNSLDNIEKNKLWINNNNNNNNRTIWRKIIDFIK